MGNGSAGFDISRAAQEDRLEGVGLFEFADDGSEGGGVPAFGGSVSGAREDGEVGLGGCVFWFGEIGGRGKLGFAFGKAKIFEKAEVLVGHMDITVGGCSAGLIFCEERVS